MSVGGLEARADRRRRAPGHGCGQYVLLNPSNADWAGCPFDARPGSLAGGDGPKHQSGQTVWRDGLVMNELTPSRQAGNHGRSPKPRRRAPRRRTTGSRRSAAGPIEGRAGIPAVGAHAFGRSPAPPSGTPAEDPPVTESTFRRDRDRPPRRATAAARQNRASDRWPIRQFPQIRSAGVGRGVSAGPGRAAGGACSGTGLNRDRLSGTRLSDRRGRHHRGRLGPAAGRLGGGGGLARNSAVRPGGLCPGGGAGAVARSWSKWRVRLGRVRRGTGPRRGRETGGFEQRACRGNRGTLTAQCTRPIPLVSFRVTCAVLRTSRCE